MSNPTPSPTRQSSTPNPVIAVQARLLHKTLIQTVAPNIQKLAADLGDTALARAVVIMALDMTMDQVLNSSMGESIDTHGGPPSHGGDRKHLDREGSASDSRLMSRTVGELDMILGEMGERVEDILEETKKFHDSLCEFIVSRGANHEPVE
ncbi:hypothetical protein P691DRAFT_808053 [Macrolepiota fuliginosa MF-IS2]|uniref:Uncharacterized protein n=1 Tax=Macrolepiota fuliginosa MF-IS2 TaxID=1400762 RepID=A0A9P5X5G0_9AGAR|nr:hypothetical protein P691DRAFT_808053 [Macrolepiota fuliginosa MF-IS2]